MNPKLFGLLAFTFLFIVTGQLKAGDTLNKKNAWYPEISCGYGFVVRHHLDMGGYTKNQFPAYELSWVKPLLGQKHWHQEYRYPETGISYWYSGLGNSSVLGDVHAVTTWLRFSALEGTKWQWNYKIAAGLGYFRKKFDITENYKNLAIGSHVNASIQLSSAIRWNFHRNLSLSAGLGLAHFSNGTMISPNYGINVPWLHSTLSFHPGNLHACRVKKEYPSSGKKDFAEILISHGFKEIRPLLGPRYNVYSFSGIWFFGINNRKSLGPGLDIYYDASEKPLLERSGTPVTKMYELIKPGLSASYQAAFGNLSVMLTLGTYLYQKEKSDGILYDKVGLRYTFLDKYMLQLYLKTHYARADYLGWGVGIRLH